MPRRMSADELLETSPFHGELIARPSRVKVPKLTVALAAGVLLVAGILVGIQAQKAFGEPSAPAFPSFTRGAGGAQAGSGQAGTVGTVKLVDGARIYVAGSDGTTTVVTTDDATEVRISKEGKVADLKPGATVVVQGAKDAEGNVAATNVTEGGGLPRMRANQ
ncbi:hypothetical protein [Herbidospora cretacea]|uniref:hypothetical protein n=1 Tax=Herbidospora cretacea TaxID=28444 RepID=UPI000A8B2503|nr:hypothetical protein [Herbidospora cretacea]